MSRAADQAQAVGAAGPRSCSCGNPISPRSSTGRCRSCGRHAALAKPGARERIAAGLRKACAEMPEAERERRREHGRWLARDVLTPARWAKSQRPEVRSRVGAMNTERTLGWCPPERRDEYRRLRKSLRYSAAEARAIIEADLRPTPASASSKRPRTFEEQLALVAAGAKLVAAHPLRRPDPDGTLGGVASGML